MNKVLLARYRRNKNNNVSFFSIFFTVEIISMLESGKKKRNFRASIEPVRWFIEYKLEQGKRKGNELVILNGTELFRVTKWIRGKRTHFWLGLSPRNFLSFVKWMYYLYFFSISYEEFIIFLWLIYCRKIFI